MKVLNWIEEIMVWAIVTVAICAVLSGCAGHQAMIWRQTAPVQPPCGIKICEPHGVSNRIDPEKDCVCSGKNSVEDIL